MPAPRLSSLAGPAVALASFALVLAASRGRPTPARATPGSPASGAGGGEGGAGRGVVLSGLALRGAAPSLESLAARVVEGLRRGDREGLRALTLTRSEYREVVFPRAGLDAHAGADFYYDNMASGSLRDLERALGELGGAQVELLSVRADPSQAERHGELTIHRGVVMALRVRGEVRESGLLGGVVEHRGAFKVTRYRRDPPAH